MREFPVQLPISSGLRQSWRNPRNSAGLVRANNIQVGDQGLEAYRPPTLLVEGLSLSYPFPQLIKGKGKTFFLWQDSIFIYDEVAGLLPLELYDYQDVTSTGTITGGSYWSIADFNQGWLLTNGQSAVWVSGIDKYAGKGTQKAYASSDVKFNTACNHRGRAVVGGLNPNNFFKDEWKDFLGHTSLGMYQGLDVYKNMVWWSTIGGDDLLWFFYPELYTNGILGEPSGHSISRSWIRDLLDRNEWGMMQMSWQGEVMRTLSHGQAFIVAGTDGISALVPTNDGLFYGERMISDIGINYPGAIGGSENQKVFVGTNGKLYAIGGDLTVQELGYEEFFWDWPNYPVSTSWDASEDRYFITNGSGTYVLKKGLGYTPQVVYGVGAFNRVGCGGIASTDDDMTVWLETNPIDFGFRSIKRISNVEVGIQSRNEIYVACSYRMKTDDVWSMTEWRAINKQGLGYINGVGTEFKVHIKTSNYQEAGQIDYVSCNWTHHDKRMIRGPLAGTYDNKAG